VDDAAFMESLRSAISYRRGELGIALRIKLRRGLKLCKLRGQFLARVNKVN
jgi:hypothetical protein